MASEIAKLPKLDFSGLESGGSAAWDELQEQVIRALQSYGCFEVVYKGITSELSDALFGRAFPEIFGLPLDTKILAKTGLVGDGGYVGQLPGWEYQSFAIREEDVEKFTRKLWPQGNVTFADTISTYSKHLKVLDQIIARMIFRGLGIEKYYDSYVESTFYAIQLLEYGIPLDPKKMNGMDTHLDHILITILEQHLVEGLEIQTKQGEWIQSFCSPNTFTVIMGESFQALTNGRLQSPYHRVRMISREKRYSIAFGSTSKDGYIIQTPKELVNKEHPLVYKPFTCGDYALFLYSGELNKDKKTLHDFCGIRGGTENIS